LLQQRLFPALAQMLATLDSRSADFAGLLKSGRTHLMDATPITLGQEFAAFHDQLLYAYQQLKDVQPEVQSLALGGSAVGTGVNTHPDWARSVARQISALTETAFRPASNFFTSLAAHDVLVDLHGRLNLLATALFKMGNDLRLMNSGPRCGLAEIRMPANEPGSSIMPGKINPTQSEALTMVCVQVMANQQAVSLAASQGHFQLNVFKPLIIHNVLGSIRLLADAVASFDRHCLRGIEANRVQLATNVERSLMLVTALSPVIGYEQAARVAQHAEQHDISLREAAESLGVLSGDDFDRHVDPRRMLSP